MAEWRIAEWRNCGMAEWQNGGMVEWRNGRMTEWHNVQYKIVRNQDTESTQMPPWQSPSWLVFITKNLKDPISSFENKCRTVGHSGNAAVAEINIMTVGLVLRDILHNKKTAWAKLCKTLPPIVGLSCPLF
jgi:hypothetical protein